MNRTFFDTETSGLNPKFDQILTVFFVTFDDQGNEVDRLEEKCALDSHRLPCPEALLVNGLSVNSLKQHQSQRDLLLKVNDYINRNTPQIFFGHNAKFDRNFIANGFYQNLITDQLWSLKTNGNRLVCTLNLSKAAYSFGSGNINFQSTEAGHPIFNLSSLCIANGIEIDAHTSKGDVEALVKLVDLIKERDPEIYAQAIYCADKASSLSIINNQFFSIAALGSHKDFSPKVFYPLMFNNIKSEALCIDLIACQKHALESYSAFEISGFLGPRIGRDYPFFILPLNQSLPIFEQNFVKKINPEIDEKKFIRIISNIKKHHHLLNLVNEAMTWRQEGFQEASEPEELILPEFPNYLEKQFINGFNLASPEERVELISRYVKKSPSNRFGILARRLQQNINPETTTTADQEKFTKGVIHRLFKTATDDEPLKWCTFYSAVEKCEQLKKEHPHKIRVINEIKEFYFREAKFYGIDLEQQFRRKKYG